MELRLFNTGRNLNIPDYSIVENLLFDLVAQTPDRELTAPEKIFVIKSLENADVHRGYLADVYLNCGCFSEARNIFSAPEHPRKLGDICWAEGKLQEAEVHYWKPKSEAQTYRNSPDFDRLIKLAFFQDQWADVIDRFCKSPFSRGFTPGCVILGGSETSAQPILDLLAISTLHLDFPTPKEVLSKLCNSFDIHEAEWQQLLLTPDYHQAKHVMKIKSRCRPRICSKTPRTLKEVLALGDTPRSRHVSTYILRADDSLVSAQQALDEYSDDGSEAALDTFIECVTGSGIASVSHTFLFTAFGHDSFTSKELPPERLIKLFSRHPIMNRRHFGKLLDLRFKNRSPLTGEDILTGLFQYLGSPTSSFTGKSSELFDVTKLAWCREWARVRLDDWIGKTGSPIADSVAATWRDGRAIPTQHSLYPGVVCIPDSPRNMAEWNAMLKQALIWLEKRWHSEIGSSRWIAENQLYEILKRRLKNTVVQQHARPSWLAPQHLDVYIPQAGIAVEYMGEQHFKPLDFFGGEAAFRATLARDNLKIQLCRIHNIELIHVRFDEDIGARAGQIAARCLSALSQKH
jgi:hypothetical protein